MEALGLQHVSTKRYRCAAAFGMTGLLDAQNRFTYYFWHLPAS